jgi:hypothetical protein
MEYLAEKLKEVNKAPLSAFSARCGYAKWYAGTEVQIIVRDGFDRMVRPLVHQAVLGELGM